jgi:ligand-binding sensor domain-containing protein
MIRRSVSLVVGLLIAWLAVSAMPAFVAWSQDVAASEDAPPSWQWEPYSQGLPAYAMVVAVALQPTDPGSIYVGTYEPPGLWRSDDRGESWAADDQGLKGSPIYALHWDAVRHRWWAGARDGLYTRLVGAGSPRPCTPWQATKLGERAIYAIAEDAKGRLYLATEDGLFRSVDAEVWERMPVAVAQARTTILALAVSQDGRTLLAGTAGQGPWISRNGGAAWSSAGAAPPAPQSWGKAEAEASERLAQAYVSAVLLDPRADGVTYASTSERAYLSANSGATWQAVTGVEGRVHAFAAGPDGSVYAALAGQVARSFDSGRTWELHGAGLRPGDKVLDLAVSPADPASLYAAAWDGLYVSSDSGQSWERRSNGLGYPDVNVLAWDSTGNLLAGTRSGLYRSVPFEATWRAIPDMQDRPVLTMATARDERVFYAGCSGGLFRSTDGGRTWSEVASELSNAGIAGLVVDPADADHLRAWVAFGRVHESRDGGRNWVARWAGLGDVRPVTVLHRTDAGQLLAGAEDGLFRWEPAGEAWQLLPLPLHAPTVFAIASDRDDPEVIYAGATDGLWRSPDTGETWNRWGKGLEERTVTALARSPTNTRIAFAGTRHMGLYETENDGTTWQPAWDGRLATASVRDILFSRDGGIVYVASDQGIWQGESHGAR